MLGYHKLNSNKTDNVPCEALVWDMSKSKRNRKRIKANLNLKNVSSYFGLIQKHEAIKFQKEFSWWVFELLEKDL